MERIATGLDTNSDSTTQCTSDCRASTTLECTRGQPTVGHELHESGVAAESAIQEMTQSPAHGDRETAQLSHQLQRAVAQGIQEQPEHRQEDRGGGNLTIGGHSAVREFCRQNDNGEGEVR